LLGLLPLGRSWPRKLEFGRFISGINPPLSLTPIILSEFHELRRRSVICKNRQQEA